MFGRINTWIHYKRRKIWSQLYLTIRSILYTLQVSWASIFRRLFSKRCTYGSKSGSKSLARRKQAKFPKNCPTVFANLAWYRRTKDLEPLIDPKVHLFENSLLKMLAQLQVQSRTNPLKTHVYYYQPFRNLSQKFAFKLQPVRSDF